MRVFGWVFGIGFAFGMDEDGWRIEWVVRL